MGKLSKVTGLGCVQGKKGNDELHLKCRGKRRVRVDARFLFEKLGK